MFVYVVTNLVNSKQYVGQTTYTEVERRWAGHLRYARARPSGRDGLLHRAIRKYGEENFAFNFIELPEVSQSVLDSIERKMIARVGSLAPNGYNLTTGGGSGGRSSDETKQKMSLAKIGKKYGPMSEERKLNISKVHANSETKAKLSASLRIALNRPETRARLRLSAKTRPAITVSTRAIMSANCSWRNNSFWKGKKRGPMSQEHKAKVSASKKGVPWTLKRRMA